MGRKKTARIADRRAAKERADLAAAVERFGPAIAADVERERLRAQFEAIADPFDRAAFVERHQHQLYGA